MDTRQFQKHSLKVKNCPSNEFKNNESPCKKNDVIKHELVTSVGWGNRNSPICFLGLNPRYDPDYIPKVARTDFDYDCSSNRHFDYHKMIFNKQRHESIKEEAFYSEVAFCSTQKGIQSEIAKYCFNKNTRPFLQESNFEILIPLGRVAIIILLKELCRSERYTSLRELHGKIIRSDDERFTIIPSFHPNAIPRKGEVGYKQKWAKLITEAINITKSSL